MIMLFIYALLVFVVWFQDKIEERRLKKEKLLQIEDKEE